MTFNDDGSRSECSQSDPNVLYKCADSGNKDGGRIISYIDKSASHTTALVSAINAVKATSWTPLAETLYTAISYYGQKSALQLNSSDWSGNDPVCAWCRATTSC